jgi:hypothetical protein
MIKKINYYTVLGTIYTMMFSHIHTFGQKREKEEGVSRIFTATGIYEGYEKFGKLELISCGKEFLLVGIEAKPFWLTTKPNVEWYTFVNPEIKEVLAVKKLSVRATTYIGEPISYNMFPKWLNLFTEIDYLEFKEVHVESLVQLKYSPLKRLVLNDVTISNIEGLIQELSTLQNLECLVHTQIFTKNQLARIKQLYPQIKILKLEDYYDLIESGKILPL